MQLSYGSTRMDSTSSVVRLSVVSSIRLYSYLVSGRRRLTTNN
jgi:hypothetical protein